MIYFATKIYKSEIWELPPIEKVPDNGQVVVKASKSCSQKHPVVIVSKDSCIDGQSSVRLKAPFASYTFMKIDGSWSVV